MRTMAWLRGFIWRQWPSLMLTALLVALTCNCLFGPSGPRDLLILRHACSQLDAKRARLQADNTKLRTNVQNLESNNRYIQRLIRRELGYTRPDELVYKFVRHPRD